MTKLYNQSSEREKRRSLRNNMPLAEQIIWARLRGRQIEDCKFRRQYSIAAFVIDFYAPEIKLAIELDGDSHTQDGMPDYDLKRQAFLESKGTTVLRFTNHQVYIELAGVLAAIGQTVRQLRGITGMDQPE